MSFTLKQSNADDHHHGWNRKKVDINECQEYFYLVNPDFAYTYHYLSEEDKIKKENKERIDMSKYALADRAEMTRFSESWKSFYAEHETMLKKYKRWGIGIMLLKHFLEGRSNGYVVTSTAEEKARLIADMQEIGVEIHKSCM